MKGARADAITERIQKMRDAPDHRGRSQHRSLRSAARRLRAVVIDESFAEFQKSAGVVLSAATDSVSAILAAKVAAAEESARVKAEQEAAAAAHAAEVAEFNRQKAIADEQRRQARAKDKAEQEARERIAAETRKAEDDAHRRRNGRPWTRSARSSRPKGIASANRSASSVDQEAEDKIGATQRSASKAE